MPKTPLVDTMPDVIETASQSPAEPAKLSDEGKSGNLSASQMAHQLLERAAVDVAKQPSAEQAPETETANNDAPDEAPPLSPDGSSPDAKADGEDPNDALLQELSKDPKLKEKINKRIGKEVAKTKAEQARVAALSAELEEIKSRTAKDSAPVAPQSTPEQPLGHITDFSTLQKEAQSMKEVKRWAQAQLIRDDLGDGVEVNGKKWSKSDLQAAVLNVDRVLEDQIPQRYQFLQTRQNVEKQTAQLFPWFNDKNSDEYAQYQAAYKQYGFLANLPDAPLIIATQMLGIKAFQDSQKAAEEAKNKKPVTSSKMTPPASQVAPGASPGAIRETSSSSAQKQLAADLEGLRKKGNVSGRDLARVLQQKELLKR